MASIVKLTVWVSGVEDLNQILGAAKVSLDCGAPARDTDGSYIVTMYAAPAEAKKVTALGFRHEADASYGATLAERQKEVSQTDRFKGGKVVPTGLGTKR
jgi:hypothetical protein